MSIVIALVAVLVVGVLVTKFYPKPNPKTTESSILDRVKAIEKDVDLIVEAVTTEKQEVAEQVQATVTKKTKAPKTDAKPKRTKKQNQV